MFELDFDDIIRPMLEYNITKNDKGLFMVHTRVAGTIFWANDYDLIAALSRLSRNISEHFDKKGVE